MALSALVNLLGWPGDLQTDGALQQAVGGPRQRSGWGAVTGLVLGVTSVVLSEGVADGIELSDGQLAPSVLGPSPARPPGPADDERDDGDEEQHQHQHAHGYRPDSQWGHLHDDPPCPPSECLV